MELSGARLTTDRRGAENVRTKVVPGDCPSGGLLDGDAVLGGGLGLEPTGDRLGLLAADSSQSRLGGRGQVVDRSEEGLVHGRSKHSVDTEVNTKFIDADRRRPDDQHMVDKNAFQQRFDTMLAHAGMATLAAFADQLQVSRQVVNNWYNRDGRIAAKNRLAVQAATGVSVDWVNDGIGEMQLRSSTSQSVGLDLEKLQTSIGYVIDVFLYTQTPITSRGVARLSAGVYDLLISDEPVNVIELGERLKKQVQGEKNVGQVEAGSTDSDDHGGTKRRAAAG